MTFTKIFGKGLASNGITPLPIKPGHEPELTTLL